MLGSGAMSMSISKWFASLVFFFLMMAVISWTCVHLAHEVSDSPMFHIPPSVHPTSPRNESHSATTFTEDLEATSSYYDPATSTTEDLKVTCNETECHVPETIYPFVTSHFTTGETSKMITSSTTEYLRNQTTALSYKITDTDSLEESWTQTMSPITGIWSTIKNGITIATISTEFVSLSSTRKPFVLTTKDISEIDPSIKSTSASTTSTIPGDDPSIHTDSTLTSKKETTVEHVTKTVPDISTIHSSSRTDLHSIATKTTLLASLDSEISQLPTSSVDELLESIHSVYTVGASPVIDEISEIPSIVISIDTTTAEPFNQTTITHSRETEVPKSTEFDESTGISMLTSKKVNETEDIHYKLPTLSVDFIEESVDYVIIEPKDKSTKRPTDWVEATVSTSSLVEQLSTKTDHLTEETLIAISEITEPATSAPKNWTVIMATDATDELVTPKTMMEVPDTTWTTSTFDDTTRMKIEGAVSPIVEVTLEVSTILESALPTSQSYPDVYETSTITLPPPLTTKSTLNISHLEISSLAESSLELLETHSTSWPISSSTQETSATTLLITSEKSVENETLETVVLTTGISIFLTDKIFETSWSTSEKMTETSESAFVSIPSDRPVESSKAHKTSESTLETTAPYDFELSTSETLQKVSGTSEIDLYMTNSTIKIPEFVEVFTTAQTTVDGTETDSVIPVTDTEVSYDLGSTLSIDDDVVEMSEPDDVTLSMEKSSLITEKITETLWTSSTGPTRIHDKLETTVSTTDTSDIPERESDDGILDTTTKLVHTGETGIMTSELRSTGMSETPEIIVSSTEDMTETLEFTATDLLTSESTRTESALTTFFTAITEREPSDITHSQLYESPGSTFFSSKTTILETESDHATPDSTLELTEISEAVTTSTKMSSASPLEVSEMAVSSPKDEIETLKFTTTDLSTSEKTIVESTRTALFTAVTEREPSDITHSQLYESPSSTFPTSETIYTILETESDHAIPDSTLELAEISEAVTTSTKMSSTSPLEVSEMAVSSPKDEIEILNFTTTDLSTFEKTIAESTRTALFTAVTEREPSDITHSQLYEISSSTFLTSETVYTILETESDHASPDSTLELTEISEAVTTSTKMSSASPLEVSEMAVSSPKDEIETLKFTTTDLSTSEKTIVESTRTALFTAVTEREPSDITHSQLYESPSSTFPTSETIYTILETESDHAIPDSTLELAEISEAVTPSTKTSLASPLEVSEMAVSSPKDEIEILKFTTTDLSTFEKTIVESTRTALFTAVTERESSDITHSQLYEIPSSTFPTSETIYTILETESDHAIPDSTLELTEISEAVTTSTKMSSTSPLEISEMTVSSPKDVIGVFKFTTTDLPTFEKTTMESTRTALFTGVTKSDPTKITVSQLYESPGLSFSTSETIDESVGTEYTHRISSDITKFVEAAETVTKSIEITSASIPVSSEITVSSEDMVEILEVTITDTPIFENTTIESTVTTSFTEVTESEPTGTTLSQLYGSSGLIYSTSVYESIETKSDHTISDSTVKSVETSEAVTTTIQMSSLSTSESSEVTLSSPEDELEILEVTTVDSPPFESTSTESTVTPSLTMVTEKEPTDTTVSQLYKSSDLTFSTSEVTREISKTESHPTISDSTVKLVETSEAMTTTIEISMTSIPETSEVTVASPEDRTQILEIMTTDEPIFEKTTPKSTPTALFIDVTDIQSIDTTSIQLYENLTSTISTTRTIHESEEPKSTHTMFSNTTKFVETNEIITKIIETSLTSSSEATEVTIASPKDTTPILEVTTSDVPTIIPETSEVTAASPEDRTQILEIMTTDEPIFEKTTPKSTPTALFINVTDIQSIDTTLIQLYENLTSTISTTRTIHESEEPKSTHTMFSNTTKFVETNEIITKIIETSLTSSSDATEVTIASPKDTTPILEVTTSDVPTIFRTTTESAATTLFSKVTESQPTDTTLSDLYETFASTVSSTESVHETLETESNYTISESTTTFAEPGGTVTTTIDMSSTSSEDVFKMTVSSAKDEFEILEFTTADPLTSESSVTPLLMEITEKEPIDTIMSQLYTSSGLTFSTSEITHEILETDSDHAIPDSTATLVETSETVTTTIEISSVSEYEASAASVASPEDMTEILEITTTDESTFASPITESALTASFISVADSQPIETSLAPLYESSGSTIFSTRATYEVLESESISTIPSNTTTLEETDKTVTKVIEMSSARTTETTEATIASTEDMIPIVTAIDVPMFLKTTTESTATPLLIEVTDTIPTDIVSEYEASAASVASPEDMTEILEITTTDESTFASPITESALTTSLISVPDSQPIETSLAQLYESPGSTIFSTRATYEVVESESIPTIPSNTTRFEETDKTVTKVIEMSSARTTETTEATIASTEDMIPIVTAIDVPMFLKTTTESTATPLLIEVTDTIPTDIVSEYEASAASVASPEDMTEILEITTTDVSTFASPITESALTTSFISVADSQPIETSLAQLFESLGSTIFSTRSTYEVLESESIPTIPSNTTRFEETDKTVTKVIEMSPARTTETTEATIASTEDMIPILDVTTIDVPMFLKTTTESTAIPLLIEVTHTKPTDTTLLELHETSDSTVSSTETKHEILEIESNYTIPDSTTKFVETSEIVTTTIDMGSSSSFKVFEATVSSAKDESEISELTTADSLTFQGTSTETTVTPLLAKVTEKEPTDTTVSQLDESSDFTFPTSEVIHEISKTESHPAIPDSTTELVEPSEAVTTTIEISTASTHDSSEITIVSPENETEILEVMMTDVPTFETTTTERVVTTLFIDVADSQPIDTTLTHLYEHPGSTVSTTRTIHELLEPDSTHTIPSDTTKFVEADETVTKIVETSSASTPEVAETTIVSPEDMTPILEVTTTDITTFSRTTTESAATTVFVEVTESQPTDTTLSDLYTTFGSTVSSTESVHEILETESNYTIPDSTTKFPETSKTVTSTIDMSSSSSFEVFEMTVSSAKDELEILKFTTADSPTFEDTSTQSTVTPLLTEVTAKELTDTTTSQLYKSPDLTFSTSEITHKIFKTESDHVIPDSTAPLVETSETVTTTIEISSASTPETSEILATSLNDKTKILEITTTDVPTTEGTVISLFTKVTESRPTDTTPLPSYESSEFTISTSGTIHDILDDKSSETVSLHSTRVFQLTDQSGSDVSILETSIHATDLAETISITSEIMPKVSETTELSSLLTSTFQTLGTTDTYWPTPITLRQPSISTSSSHTEIYETTASPTIPYASSLTESSEAFSASSEEKIEVTETSIVPTMSERPTVLLETSETSVPSTSDSQALYTTIVPETTETSKTTVNTSDSEMELSEFTSISLKTSKRVEKVEEFTETVFTVSTSPPQVSKDLQSTVLPTDDAIEISEITSPVEPIDQSVPALVEIASMSYVTQKIPVSLESDSSTSTNTDDNAKPSLHTHKITEPTVLASTLSKTSVELSETRDPVLHASTSGVSISEAFETTVPPVENTTLILEIAETVPIVPESLGETIEKSSEDTVMYSLPTTLRTTVLIVETAYETPEAPENAGTILKSSETPVEMFNGPATSSLSGMSEVRLLETESQTSIAISEVTTVVVLDSSTPVTPQELPESP